MARTRLQFVFEVDWTDVGDPVADWPQVADYPSVDVTDLLISAHVGVGARSVDDFTLSDMAISNPVSGRVQVVNVDGEFTVGVAGRPDHYDPALTSSSFVSYPCERVDG